MFSINSQPTHAHSHTKTPHPHLASALHIPPQHKQKIGWNRSWEATGERQRDEMARVTQEKVLKETLWGGKSKARVHWILMASPALWTLFYLIFTRRWLSPTFAFSTGGALLWIPSHIQYISTNFTRCQPARLLWYIPRVRFPTCVVIPQYHWSEYWLQ